MLRKLIVTGDGSHSIEMPELGVSYHSIHGAVQESRHVFIEAGFKASGRLERPDALRIFEVGFGTGLNALLTLIESEKSNRKIWYETIEPYPLTLDEAKLLNYCSLLGREDLQKSFELLHACEWGREIVITPNFSFRKTKANLVNVETSGTFALVYFHAFDPNAQPELWTEQVFEKMFSILRPAGLLVTY